MEESAYHRQARLLLSILPLVGRYSSFAVKGGTAINFFIRDMPRLSVDIDLTYTPIEERTTALAAIGSVLESLKTDIERVIPKAVVVPRRLEGSTAALLVRTDRAAVKIEPNLVLRGTVFDPVMLSLAQNVQDAFGMSVRVRALAAAELYGGKICAALDRQHPRDLFDIMLLLQNEGITDAIRKSFIVHLISHGRPMSELLDPNLQDLGPAFAHEFEGMTFIKVSCEISNLARTELVKAIRSGLTDNERRFILSVKRGDPDWKLLGVEGVDRLPAVQWKLLNVAKMGKDKHKRALQKLERCLGC